MTKLEDTIVRFCVKKKDFLFFLVITVLSLLARIKLYPFVSSDVSGCLTPWYEDFLALGGLKGLATGAGDYNLLYQTIVAIISEFQVDHTTYMYILKDISLIFDYVMALSAAWMLKQLCARGFGFFNFVYTVMLFVPTQLLNSSCWGQCDSIYVSFLLLTLWHLYRGRNKTAFIFYGLSLAFKLQSIFLLPFLLTWYVYKKSFSLLHFLLSAAVIWASGIVAFIYGQSLLAPLKIYISQTGTYPRMWLNYPSFWMLIGSDYDTLHIPAVCLAIIIVGLGFYACVSGRKKIETAEDFFSLAAWFVWSCLLFLPAMHERYSFPLDALLLILAFLNLRYAKYFLLSNTISTLTYGAYLFDTDYRVNIPTAILLTVAYLLFSYVVFGEKRKATTSVRS